MVEMGRKLVQVLTVTLLDLFNVFLSKWVVPKAKRITQKYYKFPEPTLMQKVWPIQSRNWLECRTNPGMPIIHYHEDHSKIQAAIDFSVWILWFCRQKEKWRFSWEPVLPPVQNLYSGQPHKAGTPRRLLPLKWRSRTPCCILIIGQGTVRGVGWVTESQTHYDMTKKHYRDGACPKVLDLGPRWKGSRGLHF